MEGDFDSTSEKVNENYMYIEGFLNRQYAHLYLNSAAGGWAATGGADEKAERRGGHHFQSQQEDHALGGQFSLTYVIFNRKFNKVKKERSFTGQKPVMGVTYFYNSGLRA